MGGGGRARALYRASKHSGSCHCWRHLQSYTLHLCVGGVRPDPVCLCLLELRVATVNMHKVEPQPTASYECPTFKCVISVTSTLVFTLPSVNCVGG